MRFFTFLITLLLTTTFADVHAQQVTMPELVSYMGFSENQFEEAMLQKGFICYKSTKDLTDRTCLFAYAANTLMSRPEVATALLQYVRNLRSDIILYQTHSKKQYDSLRQELIRSGYVVDSTTKNQVLYSRGKTVVSCRKAETYNCISGNPAGYSIALMQRHF